MLPSIPNATQQILSRITHADTDKEARAIFTGYAETLLGHGFDRKTFDMVVQLASRPQLKYFVLNFGQLFN